MSENKILVVGSAHIDVIAKKDGTQEGIDHPGEIHFGFGGTGGNVAVKMAELGSSVRFLTAMSRGGFSSLVKANLESSGVDPWIDWREDLPQAGFSSIVEKGEMVMGVTAAPVEKVIFDDDLLDRALRGVSACFLDANLNKETLGTISTKAFEKNIPVFFSCVSEAKAHRALSVNGVSILFMNRTEMDVLARTMEIMEGDLLKKAGMIYDRLGIGMFVSLDKDGLLIVDEKGQASFIETHLSKEEIGTTLGAGDALAAGIVVRVLSGMTLETAARESLNDVQSVMSRIGARSTDDTHIDRMIGSIVESSSTDGLTGLKNRRHFEEDLQRRIGDKKDFILMYCDLDHFKQVNDRLGHQMGDKVLSKIGSILKDSLRTDDTVCRIGGDEFACILGGDNAIDIRKITERIRENEKKAGLDQIHQGLGISIGIVPWDGKKTAEEMIESADRKMYDAKHERKSKGMSIAG